jgi:hypothetical protein
LAAAKATFKKLTEQVIAAEPEPQTEHVSLNIDARIGDGLTTLMLTGPSGEPYAGSGVTLQEALISALAAMEEDLNRPKCPTCGQGWPEHLEYPTEE